MNEEEIERKITLEKEIEYWKTNPIKRAKFEHYNQRILNRKVEELIKLTKGSKKNGNL